MMCLMVVGIVVMAIGYLRQPSPLGLGGIIRLIAGLGLLSTGVVLWVKLFRQPDQLKGSEAYWELSLSGFLVIEAALNPAIALKLMITWSVLALVISLVGAIETSVRIRQYRRRFADGQGQAWEQARLNELILERRQYWWYVAVGAVFAVLAYI